VCLVVMDMSGTMPWTHHRDPRHVSEGGNERGKEGEKEGGKGSRYLLGGNKCLTTLLYSGLAKVFDCL